MIVWSSSAIRWSAAVTGVATALLVSGCGMGWEDLSIGSVSVAGDGRSLEVGWYCHEQAVVDVEESENEVRLTLRARGYRGDCATAETVVLSLPLDGRRVIDATTGAPISPCTVSSPGAVDFSACP
jgi:hypothetical protein